MQFGAAKIQIIKIQLFKHKNFNAFLRIINFIKLIAYICIMIKNVKVFFVILCLGIFLIPKNFYAEATEACCSSELITAADCCSDTHGSSKNSEGKNDHCSDSCNACGTCHSFTVFAFFITEQDEEAPIFFVAKDHFNYVTPEISDTYTKIWQPPKIG